jgi:hypothetical protein
MVADCLEQLPSLLTVTLEEHCGRWTMQQSNRRRAVAGELTEIFFGGVADGIVEEARINPGARLFERQAEGCGPRVEQHRHTLDVCHTFLLYLCPHR